MTDPREGVIMASTVLDLQRDAPLRETGSLQPGALVSLLDMLRFYAEKFVKLSIRLASLNRIILSFTQEERVIARQSVGGPAASLLTQPKF